MFFVTLIFMPCSAIRWCQVLREAKRVVAQLDKAEQQNQQAHAADPARQQLASLYSLGHKVSFATQLPLNTVHIHESAVQCIAHVRATACLCMFNIRW